MSWRLGGGELAMLREKERAAGNLPASQSHVILIFGISVAQRSLSFLSASLWTSSDLFLTTTTTTTITTTTASETQATSGPSRGALSTQRLHHNRAFLPSSRSLTLLRLLIPYPSQLPQPLRLYLPSLLFHQMRMNSWEAWEQMGRELRRRLTRT